MAKRHSNRYKCWYDKTFTKEEMKEYFGDGWSDLLDKAFYMISLLPDVEICSARRCYGMLHMYARCEDELVLAAAEGILWKVERMSAMVCEGCGKQGRRRTELKETHNFCNDCYLIYLNKVDDPLTLFLPGREGLFKED